MRGIHLAAILLVAAGCVVDPEAPPPPVCEMDTDCATGQTCRANACFGGAQTVDFAAELFAPPNRNDMLARHEILDLDVTTAGDVSVMFGPSIEITGRVLLRSNDALSAAAKVVFRRPSRIAGAPDYLVTVDALPGMAKNEAAFRARLTPNSASDTYDITIYPDDGTLHQPPGGTPPPNALAPPTAIKLNLRDNRSYDITLDSGGLKGLAGSVLDAVGNGVDNMLVRAYVRRTSGARELVSSTGRTGPNGRFELYLPLADASLFDLVVTPGPGKRWPSLSRRGVRVSSAALADGATSDLPPIMYPAFPSIGTYQLPVAGPDAAGGRKPAIGATVTFATTLSEGSVDTVTYETSATVSSRGLADVELVPGVLSQNRMYRVSVVPMPSAQHAARWDAMVPVGPPNPSTGSGGVLAELELQRRIYVTGKLVDAQGLPAVNVNVKPQLSTAFVNSLPADTLARVISVGLPEVTTSPAGTFAIYLDATLSGRTPLYDFELVPPGGSRLPRWSRDSVTLGGITDYKLELDEIVLPRTALATGTVKDVQGSPVPDAEVRVYMRDQTSARLRTLAKSDKDGQVVLVLPLP